MTLSCTLGQSVVLHFHVFADDGVLESATETNNFQDGDIHELRLRWQYTGTAPTNGLNFSLHDDETEYVNTGSNNQEPVAGLRRIIMGNNIGAATNVPLLGGIGRMRIIPYYTLKGRE